MADETSGSYRHHEPGDVVPFRSMALLMLVAALGAVGIGERRIQLRPEYLEINRRRERLQFRPAH